MKFVIFHVCLIMAGKCQKQQSWPFVSGHQWPCQAQLPSYIKQLQSQDYQTNVKYALTQCKYVAEFLTMSHKMASVFQRKGIVVKCSEGEPKAALPHQKWNVNKDSICSGTSKFSLSDLSSGGRCRSLIFIW